MYQIKYNQKVNRNNNIKHIFSVLTLILAAVSLILFGSVNVFAEVNAVTPSTNDVNRTNGWSHVNATPGVGEVDLEFVQPRYFVACFEYRTDGDTGQSTGTNYNPNVTDGLYPFVCLNNKGQSDTMKKYITVSANEYVEVRMVFGGETDERFDWTRFDVLYPRSAEITSPTLNQNVFGMVDFKAYLNDDDVDAIQWAVRQGTCAAGTNTVFGNVDGKSNTASINTTDLSNQTFAFTGDMSEMDPGMYCFIYNPIEDSGEIGIRETVQFNLVAPLTDKNVCKKGGWKTFGNTFKNQGDCVSFVATNGRNVGSGN